MANAEWHQLFPGAKSYYLQRVGSDQSPIVSCFDGEGPKCFGQFKFDKRWRNREGFSQPVSNGWLTEDVGEDCDLVSKIRNCIKELAGWKRKNKPNSAVQIQDLNWRIHNLTYQPTFDRGELQALRSKLHQAYKEEEAYWMQKK